MKVKLVTLKLELRVPNDVDIVEVKGYVREAIVLNSEKFHSPHWLSGWWSEASRLKVMSFRRPDIKQPMLRRDL